MKLCRECQYNEPAPKRTICYKCRSKAWRTKNPAAYLWHNLKKSAKKRGIMFTITQTQFVEFISKTEYAEKRGRLSDSLTIDRRDGRVGYHLSNIQILTKSENSSKYHDKENEYPTKENETIIGDQLVDNPF